MPLSVDARHCGRVYVIRCTGRIVVGEEAGVLEAAINRGLHEFVRLVLVLGEVSRVDSTGLGLLVRFLSHTRNRSGDLRLAVCPPFLSNLLQMTKVAGLFRMYDSEDQAIVSFLKEPNTACAGDASVGPKVLFVDQSPDLCAFVRVLLHNNGYETLSTCRVHDARTLLQGAKFDYVVLGPDASHLPVETVIATLRSLAPSAVVVPLQSEFKYADPEQAGLALLRQIQGAPKS